MTTDPLESGDLDTTAPPGEQLEPTWRRLLSRGHLVRLVKFGVVGLSGVFVNMAVFELCYRYVLSDVTSFWGLSLFLETLEEQRLFAANFAGLVVSIFTNFLLNDRWTWGDRHKGGVPDWLARLVKYYVSASAAGAIQLVAAWASFRYALQYIELPLLGADRSPTLSVAIGIGAGMAINFLAGHLWAFKDAEDSSTSREDRSREE
jgi:putative flippase GtrA